MAAAAIITTIDLILALLGKIGVGVEVAKSLYDSIRQSNPDLPELTDAEIIDRMTSKFRSNRERAEAALDALDSGEEGFMRQSLATGIAFVFAFLLGVIALGAQTVTVTKPGQPPTTIDCAATGCTATVVIPAPSTPPPPVCTYTVSPSLVSFEATGGGVGVTVIPSAQTCAWAVAQGPSWLNVVATSTGAGITAQANATSEARSGAVTVAGQTVMVSQEAAEPPPQPPPTQDIVFRATYTASAYPNLGFGGNESEHLGARYTRAHLATGGPQGQGAIKLSHVPGAEGQFNWGNRGNINPDVPSNGSRFYRFRMRLDGTLCGGGWSGGGSGCGTMTNKLLLVGQGCGSNCRFILTYETQPAGVKNFRLQLDGGAHLVDTGAYPKGAWLDVQVELRTASSATSGYKIWVNNNNYASPTAQRSGFLMTNANHVYTWIGGFMNDGTANAATHELSLTDFEIARTFDPTWDR